MAHDVSTVAANSTTKSLQLAGGDGSSNGGLRRTFPSIRPASISWWVRAAQTDTRSGNVEGFANSGSSSTDLLFRSYLGEGGQWYFLATGSVSAGYPYTADTWIHFELRNIDWNSRRFDFYANGLLYGYQYGFSGSGTSIGRVDLFQWGGVSYFDEIEFR